jgi:hypothetical protein
VSLNCTVILLSIVYCMTVYRPIGILLNCVNALTLILVHRSVVCTVCVLKKSCGALVYSLSSNVKCQLCHNECLSQFQYLS